MKTCSQQNTSNKRSSMRVLFIFWLTLLVSQATRAGSEKGEDHYLVVAENLKSTHSSDLDGHKRIALRKPAGQRQVELTNWVPIQKPLPVPTEKYDRVKQFGTWIVDTRKQNCLNTRAQVLIRDSLVPVEFHSQNPCSVVKGQWHDKTNQKIYEVAKQLDVDHFVPLKNAYLSGGWRWSQEIKCLYANFMGNKFHLVPMSGPENRAKSDQGPEGYMPPEKSFRCEYLRQWLIVKTIWRLALRPTEAQAIQKYLIEENCDFRKFRVSQQFIDQQRLWLTKNRDMCSQKS